MKRQYMHVKHPEPIVLEIKVQGKSHAEIAAELEWNKEQIKKLMESSGSRKCPA